MGLKIAIIGAGNIGGALFLVCHPERKKID